MSRKHSDILNMIIHLKVADMYAESFYNSVDPRSLARPMIQQIRNKIRWSLDKVATNPYFPHDVTKQIRDEINGDVLVIPALIDKITTLSDEAREAIENLVDELLRGGSITYELKNNGA